MSRAGYWQTMVAGAFDRARHQATPDRETARVAARELRSQGLTVHDIASALQLSEGAVRQLLGEPPAPTITRRQP